MSNKKAWEPSWLETWKGSWVVVCFLEEDLDTNQSRPNRPNLDRPNLDTLTDTPV